MTLPAYADHLTATGYRAALHRSAACCPVARTGPKGALTAEALIVLDESSLQVDSCETLGGIIPPRALVAAGVHYCERFGY